MFINFFQVLKSEILPIWRVLSLEGTLEIGQILHFPNEAAVVQRGEDCPRVTQQPALEQGL